MVPCHVSMRLQSTAPPLSFVVLARVQQESRKVSQNMLIKSLTRLIMRRSLLVTCRMYGGVVLTILMSRISRQNGLCGGKYYQYCTCSNMLSFFIERHSSLLPKIAAAL